jgi:L,D-peptidoglycan transpeptidase YkuD (ErfK/YbiS/YcfS/YnhG family)
MKLFVILFNFLLIGTPNNSGIVDKAIAIQKQYKVTNDKYVVMVDFSKSILQERLYVVNTKTAQIEMTSIVSHAWKSGALYASNFSNVNLSYKSSLGAYLTEDTYYGRFGYSLVLKGLDKTNSNAKKRKIIFHSSKKMSTKWSEGCFALPEKSTRKIIDMIKGGCLVYVYK